MAKDASGPGSSSSDDDEDDNQDPEPDCSSERWEGEHQLGQNPEVPLQLDAGEVAPPEPSPGRNSEEECLQVVPAAPKPGCQLTRFDSVDDDDSSAKIPVATPLLTEVSQCPPTRLASHW